MLMAVIRVKDYDQAHQQIRQACKMANGIELRLDDMTLPLDCRAIAALRAACPLPIVLTLRKASQGGLYLGTEEARLQDIFALCQIRPDYLDLEQEVPPSFLQNIQQKYPSIRIIRSFHDFEKTPDDLMALFQSLQHPAVYAYKIATFANSALDALRMLQFVKALHKKQTVTGLCMGEHGKCTRFLSPVIGNAMCYASLEENEAVAPGQLSLSALLTTYHFNRLNPETKLYALLGDTDNAGQPRVDLDENAIYFSLKVREASLPDFIQVCHARPLKKMITS